MLRDLRGSVALVDFWDYSNAGSLRALRYVKEWAARYREFDLSVIGVHTPQYAFGRNPANVSEAIRHLEVGFPVVMDNDAIIWSAYSNRVWPTRYLIDRDGFLRFAHAGEGSYERFERSLQSLLIEAGYRGAYPDTVPPMRESDVPGAVLQRATAEIQLGYLRGTLGNPEGHGPESTVLFDDQGFHLNGRVYLRGKWYSEREGVRYDGESADEGGATVTYEGCDVNSVMSLEGGSPGKVFAKQDKQHLTKENAGGDIRFEKDGSSYILVDRPRDFHIVSNREFGEHEIALTTTSAGVELFSFSFLTGVAAEFVSDN
ncbi:MAG TPA: redoxin domain-containing protein [Bacteroidota bacterium]|nr:redoxin domain-containing protein [Bacteroidota bacterium]